MGAAWSANNTSQEFHNIHAAGNSRVHIGNVYGGQVINGLGIGAGIEALRREEDTRYAWIESHSKAQADLAKIKAIVASLATPGATDRRDDIPPAARKTFSWLFKETHVKAALLQEDNASLDTLRAMSVSSFESWLSATKSPPNLFWISEKAGSGKTTLMKFICGHGRTRWQLKNWAGDRKLYIAQHFFFHLGDQSQKSRRGLLTSLLYQICRSDESLVQRAFLNDNKDDDEDDDENQSMVPRPWVEAELWTSLGKILRLPGAAFCLFIDGLDEYNSQDRYDELAQDILELAQLPNVKVCVSSRPLPNFSGRFAEAENLRLEDLNRGDFRAFAHEKLDSTYRLWHHHSPLRQADIEMLVAEVVQRSQGVFLWVRLAVDSLCERLRAGENLAKVEECLNQFPAELEDHFRNMYERINPTWKTGTETSRCLKLALILWDKRLAPYKSRHSSLSYKVVLESEHDLQGVDEIMYAPISELAAIRSVSTYHSWERKVETCSGGLLCNKAVASDEFTEVGFAHRTVYDFLTSDRMRTKLDDLVPCHYQDEDFALRLMVARCKILVKAENSSFIYPRYHTMLYDTLTALIAMSASSEILGAVEHIVCKLDQRFPLPKFASCKEARCKSPAEDCTLVHRICRAFLDVGLYEYVQQTLSYHPSSDRGFSPFGKGPDAAILFCRTWNESKERLIESLVRTDLDRTNWSLHWLKAMCRLRNYANRSDALSFVDGFWFFSRSMLVNGVKPSLMESHRLWETTFGALKANDVLRIHVPPQVWEELDDLLQRTEDASRIAASRDFTEQLRRHTWSEHRSVIETSDVIRSNTA